VGIKKLLTVIVVLTAFSVLILLGVWQIQRLQWKQEIIEQLDREYKKEPIEFFYDYETLRALENKEVPILYGSVLGTFDKPPILLKPKTRNGIVGAHVLQPLELETGETIIVNRGWIATNDADNLNLNINQSKQMVSGIFRKPDWNRFTSNNSPSENIWMKPDIEEIVSYYKIDEYAPIMLYATNIENNSTIITQDQNWYPRNKHKQYALFWFSSAFILLILVGLKARPKKIN